MYMYMYIHASAVFVNSDGISGFGTPWEILFLANYTILTKSGNIGGYSALLSFVPELQLGKCTSVLPPMYIHIYGACTCTWVYACMVFSC